MTLQKCKTQLCDGPVVLIVMDGVALAPEGEGNAVARALTPTLDRLAEGMWTQLQAHGTAVGLPSDKDMGNSEVGHNTLGAGRVFAQGASLVNQALDSGALFAGDTWHKLMQQTQKSDATLHFIGLLSDGNVHSHETHLHTMVKRAKKEGVSRIRIHILLDGRDVGERSALTYVARLEELLTSLNETEGFDARIASGGGRMLVTMDRYNADWAMVQRGWEAHVLGSARAFTSATEAIETFRRESDVVDQYLPAFTIVDQDEPLGRIQDGDGVIFFNYRGDRAIELSRAFEEEEFDAFDRGPRPDVLFAGMMQYDGDLGLPQHFLVQPPQIEGVMGEHLAASGCRQFAISETQKYGHVTYFWNGNRSAKFDEALEHYVEIPSDNVPFEQRPWMKAAEITDRVIEALRSGQHDFLRINFPNGDMVGHTGSVEAAILAVEAVDLCLARLLPVIEEVGGVALITADHGNADQMYELDKAGAIVRDEQGQPAVKTSHSLFPVPFTIFDPHQKAKYTWATLNNPGLSAVAATTLLFLGYEPPESFDLALIQIEKS